MIQDEATGLLGRMLEVLDEVSLSSIPSIMKTSHSYKLYPISYLAAVMSYSVKPQPFYKLPCVNCKNLD